ncbi:MAG: helix-turn-helix domain-containing protein [Acidaminococcus intestini]
MNENKERWMNIDEVAEYIGVSPVTVRYWLRSGKNLPGKRVGRQWRFRIKDIDEWIKSGKSNFDD